MPTTKPNEKKTPIMKWTQATVWAVTVALTAIITTAVKSAFDAPRPNVELASVTIGSRQDPDVSIDIPPELDSKIRFHPYLANLPQRCEVDDLTRSLEDASRRRQLGARIQMHLADVIQFLGTQSTAQSEDVRRREFLQRLESRRKEYETLVQHLKILAGDFELSEKYKKHPEGGESFEVNLPRSIVDLSEIDADVILAQMRGTVRDPNIRSEITREVYRSNRLRRLFLYYEVDVLKTFLLAAKEELLKFDVGADSIIAELKSRLESAKQSRFFVTAIVTNNGKRPLPIRSIGVLMVSIPSTGELPAQRIPIRLKNELPSRETYIVVGGESLDIKLVSVDSVRAIIGRYEILAGDVWKQTSQLPDSRLLKLWEATTAELNASLRLAGSGSVGTKSSLPESDKLVIGFSVSDSVYAALEQNK